MKHLLIIILSILFLSSPVIGQETGVLYRFWDGKIVVWKTFGDDDVNKKYEGEIKNGKPNGLGILTSPYGDKHVGGWKIGKRHGQGTLTVPDLGKYVGEWKNGEMWTGIFYDNNGNIDGKMLNGKGIEQ